MLEAPWESGLAAELSPEQYVGQFPSMLMLTLLLRECVNPTEKEGSVDVTYLGCGRHSWPDHV